MPCAQFITDYFTRSFSVSELCARFGISRPTGYKWIGRFLGARPSWSRGTFAGAVELSA
ncbi:MAG: helix-turn-helix domain-containing protein [Candidatus Polarisedimenticolia bacterium]